MHPPGVKDQAALNTRWLTKEEKVRATWRARAVHRSSLPYLLPAIATLPAFLRKESAIWLTRSLLLRSIFQASTCPLSASAHRPRPVQAPPPPPPHPPVPPPTLQIPRMRGRGRAAESKGRSLQARTGDAREVVWASSSARCMLLSRAVGCAEER